MRKIAILSGKGGVGKTTITANLGMALNQLGYSVCLVDANIATANLGLHFGLTYYPVTLKEILNNRFSMQDSVFIHPSGLRIIPGSLSVADSKAVDICALRQKLDQLEYDFILVDCAPGLEREVITTAQSCNEILVVTAPELPALTDALKLIKIANQNEISIKGIVLNRIRRKPFELNPEEISSVTELPLIAKIPEDANFSRAIALKTPLVGLKPYSLAARQIKKAAAGIAGIELKESLFLRLRSFFS